MIKLGMKVKCKITGIEGIAVGITNWLYACARVCVQPYPGNDGLFPETYTVDEPQLLILENETDFLHEEPKIEGRG